jgi:hypothetical protein
VKITLWENLLNPVGREYGLSWDELAAKLTRRTEFQGQDEHPGWSPAEFRDQKRELDTVTRVWALCLDWDGGDSESAITGRFGDLAQIVHTTRKHTPEHPRFRQVLRLSRSVSPYEFAGLWRRVAAVAGDVDPSPKDCSRFWFLPGCPADAEFIGKSIDGESLDVDEWLARPDPTPVVQPLPRVNFNDPSRIEDRAIAYIAKMPEAISGSGGHPTTWNVALTLARGFSLGEERTFAILWNYYNPRCQPPWSERELRHKAKQAKNAHRVPDGYLLNDDREWTPTSKTWAAPPPDTEPDYVPEPPEGMFDDVPAETNTREPGDDTEDIRDEQKKPKTAVERYGVATLRDACMEVWEAAKSNEKEAGFTTGIGELDLAIGGLRPRHVTLMAAPTSWGKSSFGVMVADENIKRGVPTLVVSVEDPRIMYARRIAARRGGLNAIRLRDNDLSAKDIDILAQVAGRAEDTPFFLDAVGVPVEDVAKAMGELIQECGIRLVICDYVGRFRAKKANDRRNHVTFVGETLSDAIKKGAAAGIILSQLKRIEGREPTMDDVKESGDLENMAEHVLLGHRYESQDGLVREIRVAKNKDGPVLNNPIRLNFNEVSASFVSDNRTYAASDPDPPSAYGEPIEEWENEY